MKTALLLVLIGACAAPALASEWIELDVPTSVHFYMQKDQVAPPLMVRVSSYANPGSEVAYLIYSLFGEINNRRLFFCVQFEYLGISGGSLEFLVTSKSAIFARGSQDDHLELATLAESEKSGEWLLFWGTVMGACAAPSAKVRELLLHVPAREKKFPVPLAPLSSHGTLHVSIMDDSTLALAFSPL